MSENLGQALRNKSCDKERRRRTRAGKETGEKDTAARDDGPWLGEDTRLVTIYE